ncbi:right-handed parallel beta-helix repeat-containing protein [Streptomyces sp. B1866]|uniref:right-handed parallel beta-helix repeat-containing protein n=1 Tax=Streptomyces sp. B1866 TaxID=3075431 RepID=UPI00288EC62C|nr:right-handed parallel beta-helix repeat-containing protein [Streptomyces sp. B1866]MDT3395086.1 right-handed parallel beta-helix repeat-containing protein [Streptomyces sp. B1866]
MPPSPRRAACAALLALPLLAASTGPATPAAAAPPTQLYVAPWGDDHGPGTAEHPFATPARAQRAVRALTPRMTSDIVVNLRGGTYRLTRPLALSAQAGDSGTGGHRVVYQAYGYGTGRQEPVTLDGGRTVTGWQRAEGGVWRADVGDLDTRQLFVNGERARRAALRGRLPELYPTDKGYITESTAPQSWQRPQDVEFVYTFATSYSEGRCGVAGVRGDATGTEITMDQPCYRRAKELYQSLYGDPGLTAPTAVENSASFLRDQPGSWYLDRSRPGHHVLYYHGLPRNVVAPVLQHLVTGDGRAGAPLHHVALRGLEFAHTTWLAPDRPTGFPHVIGTWYYVGDDPVEQASAAIPSAVSFRRASRITFEGDRFTRLGTTALGLGEGSRDIAVRGSTIEDVSGGGIHVQSEADGAAAAPRDIRIEDNRVHDVGRDYRGSWGILLNETYDATVAHNEVDHIPYSGIVYLNSGGTATSSGGVRVVGNLVHHTNSVLIDGGGIYGNGPQGPSFEKGAVVERNVVHDVDSRAATGANFPPYALYPDDGGDHITFRDNVLYRNQNNLGGVSPRRIRVTGNFWDADRAWWWEGDGREVEYQGNTKLPRLAPEAGCRKRRGCAAVLEGAGPLTRR